MDLDLQITWKHPVLGRKQSKTGVTPLSCCHGYGSATMAPLIGRTVPIFSDARNTYVTSYQSENKEALQDRIISDQHLISLRTKSKI